MRTIEIVLNLTELEWLRQTMNREGHLQQMLGDRKRTNFICELAVKLREIQIMIQNILKSDFQRKGENHESETE